MFLNNLQRRHFSLSLQKFENTKQARGLETRQTLNLTLTQLHMLLNIDCKLLTNQNFHSKSKVSKWWLSCASDHKGFRVSLFIVNAFLGVNVFAIECIHFQ